MKTVTGKVVSNKMLNTVVVEVEHFVAHPLYNKRVRRMRKYHAHDEKKTPVGSIVTLVETKPISKTKHWKVWSN